MAGAESMEAAPNLPGPFIGFQLKHIGDFLMTLPALGLIKKHWPDEKIAIAVSPNIAPLAAISPLVDECIVIDREAGLLTFHKSLKRIREKKFGTAFIFDGQVRSVAAARLAGVQNRVGAAGVYPLKFRALYTHDVNIEATRLDSQALRSQKMVAKALGLPPEPALRPPMPPLDSKSIGHIAPLLRELKGGGPRIGLTLQGLQHEKTWPLANFAELSRRLWEKYEARLFVTGGPGESVLAEALAQGAGAPVANFCGRTRLPQLLALIMASDLFITVDTGASHLAALTETPLISIFIWTNPALWPPQSPRAHLLCYEWALARFGLKKTDGPWQTAPVVTPDMVFQKAGEIFGERQNA